MKQAGLEQRETMLERELQNLGDRLEQIELETRSSNDELRLELKALHLYFETVDTSFKSRFETIRRNVFRNFNPEGQ